MTIAIYAIIALNLITIAANIGTYLTTRSITKSRDARHDA